MPQQNIAYNCNIINMSTLTNGLLLVVPRPSLPTPTQAPWATRSDHSSQTPAGNCAATWRTQPSQYRWHWACIQYKADQDSGKVDPIPEPGRHQNLTCWSFGHSLTLQKMASTPAYNLQKYSEKCQFTPHLVIKSSQKNVCIHTTIF